MSEQTERVTRHFDKNWNQYIKSINNNLLYHHDMFTALNDFLTARFKAQSFTLVDLGCGDSSAIAGVLKTQPVRRYIGVDAAPDVLERAPDALSALDCEKKFICADMLDAVSALNEKADVIVCSYALHHLDRASKATFIKHCQEKLQSPGYFILIDGVLAQGQTRQQWLDALERRYDDVNKEATTEARVAFQQHVRNDDYPESIATYREVAGEQGWQEFDVIVDKHILAFMAFTKR